MPLHSRCLFHSIALCLVTRAFAQIPQDRFAVWNDAVLESYHWPDESIWVGLNTTLGGQLQALRPWAAVCYTEDPLYDPAQCNTVLSDYKNDHTRESIASALLWSNWEGCGYDNGCALNYSDPQPISGKPCHQGSTPPYSVAISSAQDASDIIKWATAHGVKLTIKNTGHDFLGRSSGPYSLQVFTHHLDSITYVPDFVPQGSSAAPVPALRIGAGAQLEAIYHAAEEHNVSAVLGTCLTVGAAGGYVQGGGHSVLSPAYGLTVDHVLEVEIVTADGIIRTVNAVQHSDLFWAIRGGGAGSWGIITSVTLAALPPMGISVSSLTIVPNPSQDLETLGVNFVALISKYQNQVINSGIASLALVTQGGYRLFYFWPVPQASISQLYPLFDEIRALSSDYTVVSNETYDYPTVSAALLENVGPIADVISLYGGSTELSSRFVPQSMLEDSGSVQSVAEAIWEGLQIASIPFKDSPAGLVGGQGAMALFGDMPAATKDRLNETGANPGFYEAAWQVTYSAVWTLGTSESTYDLLVRSIYGAVGPLNALGVTSSYQNEGSVWETDWQEAFFGYKYDELQHIKREYDPTNFFTTFKGVGFVPESPAFSCYRRD